MSAPPAEAESAESSNAAPAPSKPAPTKVAYHPNVRCLRGGGGVGPVILGPMYRVGEGYVSEQKATEEERANGAVEPAFRDESEDVIFGEHQVPVEGFDLRDWAAADIQGLRGADGKLDLEGAILCGVDLKKAQMQGANLFAAQLQGANLSQAELQEANLVRAQLQGADLGAAQLQGAKLNEAQLQWAHLPVAQLQGASLGGAQLQGAILHLTCLQGANLSGTDLSVLLKGSLLPKQGAVGEMEATKEDRPTDFGGADLSVLPKGSTIMVTRS